MLSDGGCIFRVVVFLSEQLEGVVDNITGSSACRVLVLRATFL